MRRKILSLFILSVISVNLMSCGQFGAQKSFSTSGDSIETAIPMEETSLTNLAPVNKWVKTTSTSIGGDMKCEDIYIRVKKVSTAENDYDYIKSLYNFYQIQSVFSFDFLSLLFLLLILSCFPPDIFCLIFITLLI